MRSTYSWLIFGLVAFDTVFTLLVIQYFGAAEVNPLMAWLLSKSVLLFIVFKLGTIGACLYLVRKSGKPIIYAKIVFWAYLSIYVICTFGTNCHAATPSCSKAVVTVYADKFEGRRMANGRVFRHSNRTVACRGGTLGSWVELRYGRRGRSVCKLTDRGRLPMHSPRRPQFDVSRQVAKDLGLYDRRYGRNVSWRYIRKAGK